MEFKENKHYDTGQKIVAGIAIGNLIILILSYIEQWGITDNLPYISNRILWEFIIFWIWAVTFLMLYLKKRWALRVCVFLSVLGIISGINGISEIMLNYKLFTKSVMGIVAILFVVIGFVFHVATPFLLLKNKDVQYYMDYKIN